jgi:hypothetical protein
LLPLQTVRLFGFLPTTAAPRNVLYFARWCTRSALAGVLVSRACAGTWRAVSWQGHVCHRCFALGSATSRACGLDADSRLAACRRSARVRAYAWLVTARRALTVALRDSACLGDSLARPAARCFPAIPILSIPTTSNGIIHALCLCWWLMLFPLHFTGTYAGDTAFCAPAADALLHAPVPARVWLRCAGRARIWFRAYAFCCFLLTFSPA